MNAKIRKSTRLVRVQIQHGVGREYRDVLAFETDVPGLVVHQEANEFGVTGPGWTITHVESGLAALGRRYDRAADSFRYYALRDVRKVIAALPSLGIDWTKSARAIAPHAGRYRALIDEVLGGVDGPEKGGVADPTTPSRRKGAR